MNLNSANLAVSIFFLKKNTLQSLIQQIRNKDNIKLTDWEIYNLIRITSSKIQKDNIEKYPRKNASNQQIQEFSNEVSTKLASYFSADHKNQIIIPIPDATPATKKHLHNKKILSGTFSFNTENNALSFYISTSGPLVYDNENEGLIQINNLIQSILGAGILLELFDLGYSKSKFFDLDNITINHPEEYLNTQNLFTIETKELSERTSSSLLIDNNRIDHFLKILEKLLNNNSPNILYSLLWYCKSLNEIDIRTIFIYRYISFEALSGIWTKTNKRDKSLQDRVKYTVAALLAKDINDLKNKQDLLKEIIDLRNELFHGDMNTAKPDEFTRKLHQNYMRLGELYKNLFVYTVTKI